MLIKCANLNRQRPIVLISNCRKQMSQRTHWADDKINLDNFLKGTNAETCVLITVSVSDKNYVQNVLQ